MDEKKNDISVDDVIAEAYKMRTEKKPEINVPENTPVHPPEIEVPGKTQIPQPPKPEPSPEISYKEENENKPAAWQVHTAQAVPSAVDNEGGYAPRGKPSYYIGSENFAKSLKAQSEIYADAIDDEFDNTVFPSNVVSEYKPASDKQKVSSELHSLQSSTAVSLMVTGVCALISIIAALFPKLLMPIGISGYIIVNIALILITIGVNLNKFLFGLKGLFTLSANHHSAVSFAILAVLVQCITAFFAPESYQAGKLHLYTPLVLTAQFLNIVGIVSILRRTSKNFLFLVSSDKKYSIELMESNNESVKIAGDYIDRQPLVAFQKSASFYDQFITNSFKADPSRFISQMIAPVGVISSLILFAASLIMYKDFFSAFAAFSAAACVFVPFAAIICANFPVSALSSLARKWGGMITGYPTIEKFARTNIVLVDAQDLFPKGSVELKSIKTFENADAKTAILQAVALVTHFGGPVSEIFSQVLQNTESAPVLIEAPIYEESLGLSAWADDTRILVGNRKLLAKYDVALPGKDIETKFTQSGHQLLYVASGGVICAMLVLSYKGDARRAKELSRLDKNGSLITVRTNDINITQGLISARFGIDSRAVRILPDKLNYLYKDNVETASKSSEALFLTKGRITAMFRLLCACAVQKSNIAFAVVLQIIAMILGFIFVAFISCYSGLEQLKTSAILLYELFWVLAIIFVPKLRRP